MLLVNWQGLNKKHTDPTGPLTDEQFAWEKKRYYAKKGKPKKMAKPKQRPVFNRCWNKFVVLRFFFAVILREFVLHYKHLQPRGVQFFRDQITLPWFLYQGFKPSGLSARCVRCWQLIHLHRARHKGLGDWMVKALKGLGWGKSPWETTKKALHLQTPGKLTAGTCWNIQITHDKKGKGSEPRTCKRLIGHDHHNYRQHAGQSNSFWTRELVIFHS